MSFNITKFSLNHKRFSMFVLVFFILVGIFSFFNHSRLEDPPITIRTVSISTYLPGLSPQQIENLITKKVEEKLNEIPEIKEIRSTSSTGESSIKVLIKDQYTDLVPIWQKIRNKMIDLKPSLPSGSVGPIVNDDYRPVATVVLALTGEGYSYAEMEKKVKEIRDKFYQLNDVSKIEIHGVQKERIYLEADSRRMAHYGITPSALLRALQKQNILSAGYPIESLGRKIIVAPTGDFKKINDIKNVVIKLPNSKRLVYLGDIVAVKRGYIDPTKVAIYFNGKPAIGLAIIMNKKGNIIKFGEQVKKAVHKLNNEMPYGYKLNIVTFQPKLVDDSINDFMSNLYQAFLIVALVVILFLGWKDGIIAAAFIPITILISMFVMSIFEIELQRVSIAALVIALGLLVDNAVVVTEDIRVRIKKNKMTRFEASISSCKGLIAPLLISTLTTILFFLPMMLTSSDAGEYMRSLSQVIMITLSISLFLSFFAIPLLSNIFQRRNNQEKKIVLAGRGKAEENFKTKKEVSYIKFYANILPFLLRMRYLVIAVSILLLFFSVFIFGFIPKKFFPESSRQQFIINVDLSVVASSRKTNEVIKKISKYLDNRKINPDIKNNIAYAGYGGARFYLFYAPFGVSQNRGSILVNVKKGVNVDKVKNRVEAYLMQNYPEVRPIVFKLWYGPAEPGSIVLRLTGSDKEKLKQYSALIIKKLYKIPGTMYVRDDWGSPALKVQVVINQEKAKLAGITSRDVARTLEVYYKGIRVGDFREEDKVIPIIAQTSGGERFNLSELKKVQVYSLEKNINIPLMQIATLKPTFEFAKVKRFNLQRTITIRAKNIEFGSAYVISKLRPFVKSLKLAPGYEARFSGETSKSGEANKDLMKYLPLCFFAVVALLILEFNSFRQTFIILMTIPLAFIGAIFGLILMKGSFGFMAILGLLSLAGIIINHGVVLLDRIKGEMNKGLVPYEAVVTASIARLRPIIVTTLTTILGLLPLMIFGGALWFSMTAVLIFGLMIGTLVTLLLVPSLYMLLYGIQTPLDKNKPNKALISGHLTRFFSLLLTFIECIGRFTLQFLQYILGLFKK